MYVDDILMIDGSYIVSIKKLKKLFEMTDLGHLHFNSELK